MQHVSRGRVAPTYGGGGCVDDESGDGSHGCAARCATKSILPHRSRVPRLKKSRNGISISKRALSGPVLRIVRILALSKLLVRGGWFCQEGIKAAGDES
jgi:hypothetical protein